MKSSKNIFQKAVTDAFTKQPNVQLNADTINDAMKYQQDMKENKKKVESQEATGASSAGQYSSPLFTKEETKEGNKLKGGLSDGMTLMDIAKKHTPSALPGAVGKACGQCRLVTHAQYSAKQLYCFHRKACCYCGAWCPESKIITSIKSASVIRYRLSFTILKLTYPFHTRSGFILLVITINFEYYCSRLELTWEVMKSL